MRHVARIHVKHARLNRGQHLLPGTRRLEQDIWQLVLNIRCSQAVRNEWGMACTETARRSKKESKMYLRARELLRELRAWSGSALAYPDDPQDPSHDLVGAHSHIHHTHTRSYKQTRVRQHAHAHTHSRTHTPA